MSRKLVKAGDLVRGNNIGIGVSIGIVIEIIDHISVPPCARILWQDGSIGKEWTDEIFPAFDRSPEQPQLSAEQRSVRQMFLEVVSESR